MEKRNNTPLGAGGMKIYLSGKITGLDYATAWQQFETVELQLQAQGFEVVNPMRAVLAHKNLTWKGYMKILVPLLFDCEAIYLLNTWVASKGAKLERKIALEIDMILLTEYTLQPAQVKDYLEAFMKAKYPAIQDN